VVQASAAPSLCYAQVAQLVEQRIENPRVGGSIPPLGTKKINKLQKSALKTILHGALLGQYATKPHIVSLKNDARQPQLLAAGHLMSSGLNLFVYVIGNTPHCQLSGHSRHTASPL